MSDPIFHTSRQALAVLRRGKKDANWFAAAEYLIERASPEVELMLEVGRELERKDQREAKLRAAKKSLAPWLKWLLSMMAILGVGTALGWLIARVFGQFC